MDTAGSKGKKGRWDWLPEHMPGVARLMKEKRRVYGDEHVAECWRRGMSGEPGWFFAREGALALGTPSTDDAELAVFASQLIASGQVLLMLGRPGQPGVEVSKGGPGHGA